MAVIVLYEWDWHREWTEGERQPTFFAKTAPLTLPKEIAEGRIGPFKSIEDADEAVKLANVTEAAAALGEVLLRLYRLYDGDELQVGEVEHEVHKTVRRARAEGHR